MGDFEIEIPEHTTTSILKPKKSTPYIQVFQKLDSDSGDDDSPNLERNADPSTHAKKHSRLEALVRKPLAMGLLEQSRSSNHPKASTSDPLVSQFPSPVCHLQAYTSDLRVSHLPTAVCHPQATTINARVSSLPTLAKKRQHITFWLKEEDEAFANGVSRFGKGNWKKIKEAYLVMLINRIDKDPKD